jgi:LDH2 family malate/lactate/ureidoglycolate dehydrogenase
MIAAMNAPPRSFLRVAHADLVRFVSTAARSVGLPADKADLLGEMLAGNDAKGVFSHGTRQIATYARLMRDGKLNNRPQVEVVRETATTAIVDGDGGLGYFPSQRAMTLAVEKALASGMAVTQSRNHGHFGAAGLYARMATAQDLLSFVTSGHQLTLQPGDPIYKAAGGSPMAFGVPCGDEDPLVLDFGAMHDLYAGDPHRDTIAALAPGLVLRSIGLGEICQAWGGFLSGLCIDPERRPWSFSGANQGGLFLAFRVDLFRDPRELRAEMDRYVRRVRELAPFEGIEGGYMPGGLELARERGWMQEGVPVGEEHRRLLEELARELGLAVPW